jgi:hypothetical protein
MNAQVTRTFSTFEIYWWKNWKLQTEKCYLGNENPFDLSFDASIVYGPVLDKCITWVYV